MVKLLIYIYIIPIHACSTKFLRRNNKIGRLRAREITIMNELRVCRDDLRSSGSWFRDNRRYCIMYNVHNIIWVMYIHSYNTRFERHQLITLYCCCDVYVLALPAAVPQHCYFLTFFFFLEIFFFASANRKHKRDIFK